MGSTDEQLCLHWNDFQQCIKSTFQNLRDENDFKDVTISCDGEQVKAHKVILSACSVTLKTILKKNPAQHPVIVLWDVSPRDMEAILDFMYHGEVNVKQDHLNSFLKAAERLRVRGLFHSVESSSSSTNKFTNNNEKPNFYPSDTISANIEEVAAAVIVKQELLEPISPRIGFSQSQDGTIEKVPAKLVVKQELSDPTPLIAPAHIRSAPSTPLVDTPHSIVQQIASPPPPDYSGYEDEMGSLMEQNQGKGNKGRSSLLKYVKQNSVIVSGAGARFQCTLCGHTNAQKNNIVNHVANIHFPGSFTYKCHLCNKIVKTRNSLYLHNASYHSKKPEHS